MTKTMMTLMAAMIAVSSLSIVPVKASVEGLSTFDSKSAQPRQMWDLKLTHLAAPRRGGDVAVAHPAGAVSHSRREIELD